MWQRAQYGAIVPWELQPLHAQLCRINWLILSLQAWSHHSQGPIPWVRFLFGCIEMFPDGPDVPEFKTMRRENPADILFYPWEK